MIRIWQDFDENCRQCWGLWFALRSVDGHVVQITGPHLTEADARLSIDED